MKIIVIGSHLCPDTIYAVCKLKEKKINFDFRDISSNFTALKEYLSLREANPIYEEVKIKGGLGIPCFLKGEEITLNLDDVL
ncbi:glutaredoxin [Cetobacterium somerae]|uniref:glutaredoxin n=1 Tax=Cetobacterium sp. NK01 TaxID=2993530 RepID=UPI002115F17E|nr:glutaredoxin [Cetobacterium sp. NK01]MCQ8211191.1 glutaredoxin [Cetobacterium sp. NK01]